MPTSPDPSEANVDVRHVAILLSDIRGFSEIAEAYPASDIVAMLNRYFQRMGNIIERYDGKIDKLMGDSILVTFGLDG
ncbi:MAG: adenylate/guanylate cyclase domain-containing protein, partial [Gammaproteobacteria bacterium]